MDYPKLISEKWNLTAKFNCLQATYFYAPSALAVPMCEMDHLLCTCHPAISASDRAIIGMARRGYAPGTRAPGPACHCL